MRKTTILSTTISLIWAVTAFGAERPAEGRLRPTPEVAMAKAEQVYNEVYVSAPLIDLERGFNLSGVTSEVADLVLKLAAKRAADASGELRDRLDSFVSHTYAEDYKPEQDTHYLAARRNRDRLFRNLLVIKAVSDLGVRSSTNDQAKAKLVNQATETWTGITRTLLHYFPKLGDDRFDKPRDEKLVAHYRRLRLIARRNIITSEELLMTAPPPSFLPLADEEQGSDYWLTRATLLCYGSDYQEVLEICRQRVSKAPVLAERIAMEAVESFQLIPDHAGRSERGRDAARSLRASDFGVFIKGLSEITALSSYRELIPEAFAKFCAFRRPIDRRDFELAFAPWPQRSDAEVDKFVTQMLELLRDVTTPSPKGNDPSKRINDEQWSTRISEEYAALDAILAEWQKTRDSWRRNLIRSEVQWAWGSHQLGYVETRTEAPEPTSKFEAESKASSTDVEGYRTHLGEWKMLVTKAAAQCLADKSVRGDAQAEACRRVLFSWFVRTVHARSEPAYPKKEGEGLVESIRAWITRLPEPVKNAVLPDFAREQLKRLSPDALVEEKGSAEPIKHEHKFDFVETVASLAPGTDAGQLFERILEDYRSLTQGVRFYAVPEGEVYEAGKWIDGALPTFPVERKEFGVWFTLVHTPTARRASGGFRRYAQNDTAAVNADDYASLSETERTKYADDFKRYLEHQLTESFEVVLVAPHTKPEVSRNFDNDGQWQETPLYYAILHPKGNATPQAIPPLRLDLDFPHRLGRVVLPFHSQATPIRPEDGKVAHVREGVVKQKVQDAYRDQGQLTLEIVSESLGLPPEPHLYAANIPPEGFGLEEKRTHSEVEVVSFPAGARSPKVKRTTTYYLLWGGSGLTAAFKFPSYRLPESCGPWKIDSFMERSGQLKERYVPGGEVDIPNLPWRLDLAKHWLRRSSVWIGSALLGLIVIWAVIRLARRQKRPKTHTFPLTKPTARSPLAVANFLRRIQTTRGIQMTNAQIDNIREDVERLENLALQDGTNRDKDVGDLTDKWLKIARDQFVAQ